MRAFTTASVLLTIAACAVPVLPVRPAPTEPGRQEGREQPRGALVIVGGGWPPPPEVLARALDLAGGPKARILVIPFASSSFTGGGTAELWRRAGARNVAVLDRGQDRRSALREVQKADLLWFIGGDQSQLMDALDRLELVEAIRRRFQEGATVGGTSAGAAVMSRVMLTGARDPSLAEAEGLGLWPEVIVDQHYLKRNRRARLREAVLRHPNLIGVGIDEFGCVIVRGREFEVVGPGEVEVLVPNAKGKGEDSGVTAHRLRPGTVSAVQAYSPGGSR
jgi:cyanophycinase